MESTWTNLFFFGWTYFKKLKDDLKAWMMNENLVFHRFSLFVFGSSCLCLWCKLIFMVFLNFETKEELERAWQWCHYRKRIFVSEISTQLLESVVVPYGSIAISQHHTFLRRHSIRSHSCCPSFWNSKLNLQSNKNYSTFSYYFWFKFIALNIFRWIKRVLLNSFEFHIKNRIFLWISQRWVNIWWKKSKWNLLSMNFMLFSTKAIGFRMIGSNENWW